MRNGFRSKTHQIFVGITNLTINGVRDTVVIFWVSSGTARDLQEILDGVGVSIYSI